MNSTSASAQHQKQAIRQLMIDFGAAMNNRQRQTLIEIYIALDNARRAQQSSPQPLSSTNSHSNVGESHEHK